jgi:hypothetical protein
LDLEAEYWAGQDYNFEVIADKDDYRIAIFSGRLEDLDYWKRDIESFIGAKDPKMTDIIVGLTKSPISGDEVKSYDEKNVKGYFTLKKYLRGAAANLIEKFRLDKDGAGAFKALTDNYELRGKTQKALLMSEFSHLNFNENGHPSETFEAEEELARKIKHQFDMEIDESSAGTTAITSPTFCFLLLALGGPPPTSETQVEPSRRLPLLAAGWGAPVVTTPPLLRRVFFPARPWSFSR